MCCVTQKSRPLKTTTVDTRESWQLSIGRLDKTVAPLSKLIIIIFFGLHGGWVEREGENIKTRFAPLYSRYHEWMRVTYIPFHGTVVAKSPNSGWGWWRVRGRGRSKSLRLSSTTSSATCRSTIGAGIVRNRCKACETWLWTRPTNTAPARRIPSNVHISKIDVLYIDVYIYKQHKYTVGKNGWYVTGKRKKKVI